MTVGVLTTCHAQYTWDRSICIVVINRTTLQVFVTYLTGALFCDSTNINTKIEFLPNCLQHISGSPFAAILVNCAPSGEMHNYCTPHIIRENLGNFLFHRRKYIFLSQVYCVWQVIKIPKIILNSPVFVNWNWVVTRWQ